MRATIAYIQEKFEEFNRLYFKSQLPAIPITLGNAGTYLGVCAFKTKRDSLGHKQHYDFRFRFSTRFDMPEEDLEDTILHEMIHYYIAFNNLKDTSTHGQLFRKMMEDFNARFGRHITISHRLTEAQRADAEDKRKKLRVVAKVSFKNLRVGIKCLPRIRERIAEYSRLVRRVPEVNTVTLYMTENTFFNRYPTSSALKVYYIDEAELAKQLEGATLLDISR